LSLSSLWNVSLVFSIWYKEKKAGNLPAIQR